MKFLLFIYMLMLVGCKAIPENVYFEYDSVIHYKVNLSEKEIYNIEKLKDKSNSEEKFLALYFDPYPKELVNEKIFDFGYTGKKVSSYKLKELNRIFRNRNIKNGYDFMCINKFRDILVFKKNSQVVGIAKICFLCKDKYIIGTHIDTFDFGLKGNYDKLEKLLDK